MTAPAHPDRQGTREALTEALRVGEPWPGAPRPEVIAERIADVVERLCDQRAAEALEEAATDAMLPGVFPSTQRWLLARAAALADDTGET